MTTSSEPAPGTPRDSSVFDTVADYDEQVWHGYLGLSAALAILVLVLALTRGSSDLTLDIWLGSLAAVFLSIPLARLWGQQTDAYRTLSRGDVLRLAALGTGGLAGFATFLYGILLVVVDHPSVFAGKIDVMRENIRTILFCALPLFGGLALMYAGLALGRKFERTQPALRRLLYGYEAVLGGGLLFAILGLLNLLAYTHVKPFSNLGGTLDWSGSGLYTLQEGSRKTVADLKEPVEVKVILRRNDPVTPEVETLLENCRQVNPEIRWLVVARDENDNTLQELAKNYQIPGEGLLVLYGKPGAQVNEFIKREELVVAVSSNPRDPEGGGEAVFQGEYALIKTLSYLEEGKTRTTVYFTQGNGELNYGDFSTGRGQGLGVLVEQLGKGNYDLLQGPADSLPEKADVVVIAGPRKLFSPEALAALRKFLKPDSGKKPGKLLILFDVVVVDDKMAKTGLEDLVAEYNVTVGDGQILCALRPNPREVVVMPNMQGSNPIPKAFYDAARMSQFPFFNVRTVQPGPPNPARSSAPEVLLETNPQYGVWAEDNLKADPKELADVLRQNREKLLQRVARAPLPVAVAVSASDAGGLPPGHPSVGGGQKPVLIAFGNAGWVSNQEMRSQNNFRLFTGCLAWLRERPEIGQMPSPPKRPTYEFNVTEEQQRRLFWLPGFLILLTIISLSLGVWLVRRR